MRCRLFLILALLMIVPSSASAAASVKIKFLDMVYNASPTQPIEGYICVYASVTGTPPPALAGYQMALSISPALSGVTFTGVQNTSAGVGFDPVFPSSSPQLFQNTGAVIKMDSFLGSGSQLLTDGAGLARINFMIDPGTQGTFSLAIDPDPALGTVLADSNGDPVPFTADPGTITVSLPEPALLPLLAVPALFLIRRSRRYTNHECG